MKVARPVFSFSTSEGRDTPNIWKRGLWSDDTKIELLHVKY